LPFDGCIQIVQKEAKAAFRRAKRQFHHANEGQSARNHFFLAPPEDATVKNELVGDEKELYRFEWVRSFVDAFLNALFHDSRQYRRYRLYGPCNACLMHLRVGRFVEFLYHYFARTI
jgi:hypothetical protein